MKTILSGFIVMFIQISAAQTDTVQSGVYYWDKLTAEKDGSIEKKEIVNGTAADFASMDVYAVILKPSQSLTNGNADAGMEELIIVKEGKLKVTINEKSKTVGPGSVVLIMPGEKYNIEIDASGQSAIYVMKYVSKSPPDKERGKKAGGSLMVDWNDLVFNEHDRGGIRQYFERPTVMAKRFEMHVTTLKGEIKSHEPHTHRAEEIVLVLNGNVEMQIGEGFHKASVGDLIYLGSNVPHALKNTGKEPCMYFAFQFE